jgi:3-hydroxyacyl-CoA dehydrogenase/enoyl-CoA hydratase/3-hydroxybutyryl-CoA epimerase
VEAALDRLIPDLQGVGIARAELVIEAIVEDAAAKRELYRQIEPRLRPDAILATNTSSIPLEELAGELEHPDRLVGLHFFNPVAKMQLVEVVQGKATAAATAARAASFIAEIKRLPLPVASAPGFLVNRVLMPYLLEAVVMETEGIPATAIDGTALEFGMPMGPLLLADTVGLDICLAVARIFSAHGGGEVPKRLTELVAAGHLGKKSGRGFYLYTAEKPVGPDTKEEAPPSAELQDRLVLRLLNESVACWREKVAADADLVDAGVVFGAGFAPFRGGPIRYIREAGASSTLARLTGLAERYGSRFAPDAGWRELLEGENRQ